MNQDRLIFTNTRLVLSGKKGILRPDSEGYYEFPIGAFNCRNSANEIYTADNIDRIFAESSAFMRKVSSGKLFGEWGHPRPYPNESPNQYMARASNVEDKDTCVFFKEIWNDPKAGKHFTQYKGIDESSIITFGRLKPHGIKWEVLQRAIDDPNVNIAFSVRNLGRDRLYRGDTYVSVEEVITYDAVTEQGVASSEKHASMRLESFKQVITPRVVEQMRTNLERGAIRMENADNVRSIIEYADAYFRQARVGHQTPSYANW